MESLHIGVSILAFYGNNTWSDSQVAAYLVSMFDLHETLAAT